MNMLGWTYRQWASTPVLVTRRCLIAKEVEARYQHDQVERRRASHSKYR